MYVSFVSKLIVDPRENMDITSQIDLILNSGKWRISLQDVKACRGADIANDHTLMIGNINSKLRKAKREQEQTDRFSQT